MLFRAKAYHIIPAAIEFRETDGSAVALPVLAGGRYGIAEPALPSDR
jgi:hypothetical protein